MNSISKGQFCALLLISDMFSLFCLRGAVSLGTVSGISAGIALQFLVMLIFVCKGGELKKWAKAFYLVYSVFCGGVVFAEFLRTCGIISISHEEGNGLWGRLITAGLTAVVCLYCARAGLRAAARGAVIVGAAGALFIAADLLSALVGGETANITVPHSRGAFFEVIRGFAASGSLGSFAVFSYMVKDRASSVVWYFGTRAVLSAAVLFTALAETGRISGITEYPVITAVQLSQPFEAQRIDSVFLLLFSVAAVFSAALQVITGAHLMSGLFPRTGRFGYTSVLLMMLAAAFIFYGNDLAAVRACAAAAALLFAPVGAKISAVSDSG